ncbi:UDP-N-acetylmuramoyl-L-alanyl-D-glutamate--2,6-diaminopimelate ligase [Aestuariirhabdus sp. Z083]|nr:UDP-N-acetylmuramoyl-L-alanyl-D-glutamate--2,6-diaminopimelate ligase [Aestuariirhabdus haliotis]
MQLSQLLEPYASTTLLEALKNVVITGVAIDSRKVVTGNLFLALPGVDADGRHYIDDAISAGASAVVVEADHGDSSCEIRNGVCVVALPELSNHVARIIADYYRSPSDKLRIFGVTGTNGKTSCSHYLAQLLDCLGEPCGVMGTLGSGFVGSMEEGLNTTPDLVTTQQFMAELVSVEVKNLAMEASSHGLEQGRTEGVGFTTAIFTNLTRDHLDYHGDMEQYSEAKARLFAAPTLEYAVINRDDEYAPLMKSSVNSNVTVIDYSLRSGSGDVYPERIVYGSRGIQAHIVTPWGDGDLQCALLGDFNLANVLAVIAALCVQGYELPAVLSAANTLVAVDGRMQLFGGEKQPLVVIDYAHTPDALISLLAAVSHHCHGRIVCVFGCGGDRDVGKRPLMLQAALAGAEMVMVTSDNPRCEDPDAIISDVMRGINVEDLPRVQVISDRKKAIRDVVSRASVNDVVVVAGKGHERYQEVNTVRHPFSDQEQVELALQHWQGDAA